MSIIYNDTQEKSELQRRIQAELRQKQLAKPLDEGSTSLSSFDDTADADYTRDFRRSPLPGWLWGVMIIAFVVGIVLALMYL